MKAITDGKSPEATVRLFDDDDGRRLVERTRETFEQAFASVALWVNVNLRGTEEQVEAFTALSKFPSGAAAVRDELARIRGGKDAEKVAAAETKERERRRQGIPEVPTPPVSAAATQTLGMSGMGSGVAWR